MKKTNRRQRAADLSKSRIGLLMGGALLISGLGTVHGATFTLADGAVAGTFDSVMDWGGAWRLSNVAAKLSGPNNGGNFNFDRGDMVLNRVTGYHELGLTGNAWGAFVRGTYFYDYINDRKDLEIPGIANKSDHAWKNISLLDAYVYGDVGPVRWRLGKQVISWGESTFIGGSLNDINTVAINKLRAPGSDLRQALLPTAAAYLQWQISPSNSADFFTLLDADSVTLDAAGTFWNTNAAIADGGYRLGPLVRSEDREARTGGQRGVALHHLSPNLFQGVDFGAYYYTVHSHLPYLSAIRAGGGRPARFFLDYPEGVELWGLSFNTTWMPWAIGGEWSHRRNAPTQLNGFVQAALGAPSALTPNGPVAPGTRVRGWDSVEVDQMQMTFQRTFIPRLIRAENGSVIIELARGVVGELPRAQTLNPVSSSYWGFQVRASVDYNRAIANIINLTPTFSFGYDVNGVSSEVAPNFIEGRKSLGLGVNWSYLVNLQGSIQFVRNFGGTDVKNATGGLLRGDADRTWLGINVSRQF